MLAASHRALAQDLAASLKLPSEEAAIEQLARTARAAGSGSGLKAWIGRAFRLGVSEVVFKDLGAVDGRLLLRDNRRIIEIHGRRPRCRQLFSLAHELAHLLLERQMPKLSSSLKERSLFHTDFDEAEERLADRIAATMLMPADLVHHAHQETCSTLDAVFRIAAECSVSLSAAARRLSETAGAGVTLIAFRLDEPHERLVYRDGPFWKLPFGSALSERWSVPLAGLELEPLVNRTQRVRFCVETHPGIEESATADCRWTKALTLVAGF